MKSGISEVVGLTVNKFREERRVGEREAAAVQEEPNLGAGIWFESRKVAAVGVEKWREETVGI